MNQQSIPLRRVVVTGLGIKSAIGNSADEVVDSLRNSRSGIVANEEYAELGFRSHVYAPVNLDIKELVDRRKLRFMSKAAAFSYLAMVDAIADAGLDEAQISNPRTGLIVGTGGVSTEKLVDAVDTLRERGARKVSPTYVPAAMTSGSSANLSVAFAIKGYSYSISSACTTSLHCIGNACELIQMGKQDVMFAGGGEETHWAASLMFDAMGALSSQYNDNPAVASRPFDSARDGFVISEGGAILVLEELQHALDRGAPIYGEIVGYGASCDGGDMVKPNGEGATRAMRLAMENLDIPIDYLNAHATSTPAGDTVEVAAIKEVFGDKLPRINSTKALTGHALGGAGAIEAIASILMMKENFVCASAHIDNLDEDLAGVPIVKETEENVGLNAVMSNSFGFGGANGSLVIRRMD